MQQQQGAMGMGPQGPSQPYNISECNAWQEYEFYTQDELHQVFMMEVSRNPETLAQQALDTEGLMNVMNNTPNISNYYGNIMINWSREVFSIMIAKFGHSRDGFMQWPEFLELQEHLVHWFDNFMQYDVNRSGFIAGQELVVSIISTLFEQTAIDNTTVITLIKRFSKKTCLAFDGFVSVCVRLRAYTDFDIDITTFLTDASWRAALESEFQKPYFKMLAIELELEYKQGKTIFPPKELIFNALNLTPLYNVKVVICGQDPYDGIGQAMGLSFSVPKGIKVPPSLKNIYKELVQDISGFKEPDHGCLEKWAKDGVLLLNATLTVEAGQQNNHASFGWQKFTDHVIMTVSDRCSPAVFMLWGGFAHKKEELIDNNKHKVIKIGHPSPLSNPESFPKFKGSRCFSECNKFLTQINQTPIDWSL